MSFSLPSFCFRTGFLLLLASLFFCSCASVSVQKEKGGSSGPNQKPSAIYVTDFTFEGTELNVDRDGQDLVDFKKNLQTIMTAGLVKRFSKNIAPAQPVESIAKAPIGNNWVVTGNFVRVNQGSRALRTTLGFGAGGTKMEADIRVYNRNQPGQQPFLTFQTTGGSNAEPGALAGFGPGSLVFVGASMVASGGSVVFHGVTEDAGRTSRMIVANLSDYLYLHGLIPWNERQIPRRQTD